MRVLAVLVSLMFDAVFIFGAIRLYKRLKSPVVSIYKKVLSK